ncbi:MAG: UDP-N-acetylmuramoyl-L-alanine--D-glutamate ligase, partial [bacterium]
SEVELAYRLTSVPIIAITGTNGKTTTTSLTAQILSTEKDVRLAGNIGIPFIEEAFTSKPEYFVLEVSSFQLQGIRSFRPKIGVLLNIASDHLNWHNTMEEYIEAKKNLFANQGEEDILIYNRDDRNVVEAVKTAKSRKISFSLEDINRSDIYIKDNSIRFRLPEFDKISIPIDKIKLIGKHNIANVMCASTVGLLCGITVDNLLKIVESFTPYPHTLERFLEYDGLTFIDDSKATNPHATVSALRSISGNKVLILGGQDKGMDFTELLNELKISNVRHVCLIGETKDKFKDLLLSGRIRNFSVHNSLEEAVMAAIDSAEKGDFILFSPACASFDMFKNYVERGERFKEIVYRWKNSKG